MPPKVGMRNLLALRHVRWLSYLRLADLGVWPGHVSVYMFPWFEVCELLWEWEY